MSPRKLTAADKEQILELYRLPQETTSTLAERFSVSSSTISRFLKSRLKPGEYEDLIQQKRLSRTPTGAAQVMSQFEQRQKDDDEDDFDEMLGEEIATAEPVLLLRQAVSANVTDSPTIELQPSPAPEPQHQRRPRAHPSAGVGTPNQHLELPPISAYGTPTDRSEWDIDEEEEEAQGREIKFPTPSPWSGMRSPFASKPIRPVLAETPTPNAELRPVRQVERFEPDEEEDDDDFFATEPVTDEGDEGDEPDELEPDELEPEVDELALEPDELADEVYALEAILGEAVDSLVDEDDDEDEDFEDDEEFEDDDEDEAEDDDEEDDDEDQDWSGLSPLRDRLTDVEVLPLSQATFPRICYLVIDRAAELITHPLQEFRDLGNIPMTESQQQTLPIFDNHRVARRFSKRNQRVIKVPDAQLFEKTRPYLQAKGITRVLLDGQVYSLV